MTANQKRARQARCALKAFGRNRQATRFRAESSYFAYTEEAITDLVADLYHLAQAENVDVITTAHAAMAHFKAELVAEPEQSLPAQTDRSEP